MDYLVEYKRWLNNASENDLKTELAAIAGDDDAIKDRFASALAFGTAGLRGVLGAGPNRMNVYTVAQVTQGLAEWVLSHGGGAVAISYDSRHKSAEFASEAASVLAANGVKAHIFDRLMPTPLLSFAVRELGCRAGIMITASHNPAKYNGYKAYGPDGCQMTEGDAGEVYSLIQKTDIFTGVKRADFAAALESGDIEYISDAPVEKYYCCVKEQSVEPGICKKHPIRVVYSPLNGTGNEPVRRIMSDLGVSEVFVVGEQEKPDGDFPTCPYPNPETREALALGLKLAEQKQADVFIATDPDADRAGVAFRCADGSYRILTGNEIGALLLWFVCSRRTENGTMPKNPVAVESIVSTELAGDIARSCGVEMRRVLTGFKYIGEQILRLEEKGEQDRFIFGFEESCGYLAGSYVRDKDAVLASLLLCEFTAWLKGEGMSAEQLLESLFEKYGYYKNKVESFEFAGLDGKERMSAVMQALHSEPPREIEGLAVTTVGDYQTQIIRDLKSGADAPTGLPQSDAVEFILEGGASVMVRPSGTEPKMKVYLTAKESSEAASDAMLERLSGAVKGLLGL